MTNNSLTGRLQFVVGPLTLALYAVFVAVLGAVLWFGREYNAGVLFGLWIVALICLFASAPSKKKLGHNVASAIFAIWVVVFIGLLGWLVIGVDGLHL